MGGDQAGTTVRERRNVWALTREEEWHPVIRWYAEGIRALQDIADLADPRSWLHLANIHGTTTPRADWPPSIGDRGWNACQHGSWYFLPWHRIYLHHYERIVRSAVVEHGGPDDWALPFWAYDPADQATLALPPAFLAATTPDGEANPLFVDGREASVKAGGPVPAEDVETVGFDLAFTSDSVAVPTFGGPKTGWSHSGQRVGALETEPHGLVHVAVGGRVRPYGLMSLFETAAQDPIFWLHHANVDRLWELWRGRAGNVDPDDADWLGAGFQLGTGEWTTALTVAAVLDTTAAPLRYRYEGLPVAEPGPGPQPEPEPELAVAVAGGGGELLEVAMADEVPPELVGASDEPVRLGGTPSVVAIPVTPAAPPSFGPELAAPPPAPSRVYLTLEHVTGSDLGAGAYAVHVGVPDGADPAAYPDRYAGRISTFGVIESTRSDDVHSGSGLTFSFDVTEIVRRLEAAGEWDPANVRVTITPATGPAGPEPAAVEASDVQVGRIGVYYG